MWYINPEPTENGAYGNPMSNAREGMLALSEELLTDYLAAKGFVFLTVGDDNVITAVETNTEALEAYEAEHTDTPEPEPTPQEDTDAMLVDHELRLTLLELGV